MKQNPESRFCSSTSFYHFLIQLEPLNDHKRDISKMFVLMIYIDGIKHVYS